MATFDHKTVLLQELVDALALQAGATAVDCTAGGGGHTARMLQRVGNNGRVIALDQDALAIEALHKRFAPEIAKKNLIVIKAPFSKIKDIFDAYQLRPLSAICADIGVSSPQLDQADRGFSFDKAGPLDMRMDKRETKKSAADLVNEATEADLTEIFLKYGEEPKARFVARAIIAERQRDPIMDTVRLAAIVKGAIFYKTPSRKHPATRIFQALRIAVNRELEELKELIDNGFELLEPSGRMAIISFHSLEDKIVKAKFNHLSGKANQLEGLKDLPLTAHQVSLLKNERGRIVKPFPLAPSLDEIKSNPRSRSAKLRVIEKN